MTNRGRIYLLLVAAGLLVVLPTVTGQNSLFSKFTIDNFKQPLAVSNGKYRAVIMGKQARIQPDGKSYLVKEMKLETYHDTGERELLAEAPECLYNNDTKTASSASHLKLQTLNEGRFSEKATNGLFIEGDGFEWNHPKSHLVVSNKVHTVLHHELFQSASKTNAPKPGTDGAIITPPQPLEIFSGHGEFSITNRHAVYSQGVKVIDPRTEIQSETLVVQGITSSNNQVASVVAERNVRILNKEDNSVATGDKAVYSATNNVVTLTGNPAIETAQGKMSGNELILRRDDNELFTRGNVRMNLYASTNVSTNHTASVTNRLVGRQAMELTAESARVNLTNRLAVYTGNVNAEDPKMKLNAQWLAVQGAIKGSGLESLHATNGVVFVDKDDKSRATGDAAIYTATNDVVLLIGNSRLENEQGKLAAESIRYHRGQRELFASNHVRTEIASLLRDSVKGTNALAKSHRTNAPMMLEADRAHILATNKLAIYEGNVRADDAKSLLTCGLLTVQGMLNTNRLESIIAERQVMLTNRIDHSLATAERAVFQADKDVVTLSGDPSLENEQGKLFGKMIIVDRGQNILKATEVRTEIQPRSDFEVSLKPKSTNAPPVAKQTNQTPEPMMVFANRLEASLTNRTAFYEGGVRVESSRMQLDCETLTVVATTQTNGVKMTNSFEQILAEGNVVIVNKADNTKITGQKAVYLASNNTVEVSGKPTIQMVKGQGIFEVDTIIWDRNSNVFRGVGTNSARIDPRVFQKARTNSEPAKP